MSFYTFFLLGHVLLTAHRDKIEKRDYKTSNKIKMIWRQRWIGLIIYLLLRTL